MSSYVLEKWKFLPEIFKQSMGARNRVRTGLSYRPAMLNSLAEYIPWNKFLGSLKVKKNRALVKFLHKNKILLSGRFKNRARGRQNRCDQRRSDPSLYALHWVFVLFGLTNKSKEENVLFVQAEAIFMLTGLLICAVLPLSEPVQRDWPRCIHKPEKNWVDPRHLATMFYFSR